MVKKYLQWSTVGIEKGPHKSQWINSKQELEKWELLLKGKRFYLASGQMSQLKFSIEVKQGTSFGFIDANLALDRWPNLECQRWGCALCTEVEIEAAMEGVEMLPLSSK